MQLLYWKADPNVANEKGHTALMMAAATGTGVNEADAVAIVKQVLALLALLVQKYKC